MDSNVNLHTADPKLSSAILDEENRQEGHIALIASEHHTRPMGRVRQR